MYQVVVAGGGPVGLCAAAELARLGVKVVVLESMPERPSGGGRSSTVHPRTMELLRMRGLDSAVLENGVQIPASHFGLMDGGRLDYSVLDTPFPFVVGTAQAVVEQILEDHARELGAEIRRGHIVLDTSQTPSAVVVRVDGPDGLYSEEAEYLIGADGARSRVRTSAGVEFAGRYTGIAMYSADVRLDAPPDRSQFIRHGPEGLFMILARPGNVYRFGGIDAARQDAPIEETLTLAEVRDSVRRVAGTDFGMHDPVHLAQFANSSKLAETYRAGRVFLAGDAAHINFPAGGVGLNVGLQDAFNLGWKLAATLRGWAPDDLLDSYHAERHPLGAKALESTNAQLYLATAFSPEGQALRRLFERILDEEPGLNRRLAEQVSALDVRYPTDDPAAHPLTGTRLPDLAFENRPVRAFQLLAESRGPLLLDLTGGTLETDFRFDTFAGVLADNNRPEWTDVRAALIRPDGYVWWATDEPDPATAKAAIRDRQNTA